MPSQAIALLPAISDGVAFAAMGLLVVMCIHGVRRAMRFPPSVATIALTAYLSGFSAISPHSGRSASSPRSASLWRGGGPDVAVRHTHCTRSGVHPIFTDLDRRRQCHCRRYSARDCHRSCLGEFSRISRSVRRFARSARTWNDAGHRYRLEGGWLAWRVVATLRALRSIFAAVLCSVQVDNTTSAKEDGIGPCEKGLAPVGVGLDHRRRHRRLFRLSDGGVVAVVIVRPLRRDSLHVAPRFPVLGVLALGGVGAVMASTLSTWVSGL